jgi:deazaflavin-dependent oxidoreductase (nitroreductase family)
VSPLLVLAGIAVTLPATAAGAVVLGIRRRDPRVVGFVNRWQRRSVNPRQLATAGTVGARMSVVEHVGRRSGRAYATPVGATDVGGDLVVMLPYGSTADWVRNVRAAGGAVIRYDGRRVTVGAPQVVSVGEVAAGLSGGDRWAACVFGIREALVLHPDGAASAAAAAGSS